MVPYGLDPVISANSSRPLYRCAREVVRRDIVPGPGVEVAGANPSRDVGIGSSPALTEGLDVALVKKARHEQGVDGHDDMTVAGMPGGLVLRQTASGNAGPGGHFLASKAGVAVVVTSQLERGDCDTDLNRLGLTGHVLQREDQAVHPAARDLATDA
jgi:hypothetical protein